MLAAKNRKLLGETRGRGRRIVPVAALIVRGPKEITRHVNLMYGMLFISSETDYTSRDILAPPPEVLARTAHARQILNGFCMLRKRQVWPFSPQKVFPCQHSSLLRVSPNSQT